MWVICHSPLLGFRVQTSLPPSGGTGIQLRQESAQAHCSQDRQKTPCTFQGHLAPGSMPLQPQCPTPAPKGDGYAASLWPGAALPAKHLNCHAQHPEQAQGSWWLRVLEQENQLGPGHGGSMGGGGGRGAAMGLGVRKRVQQKGSQPPIAI